MQYQKRIEMRLDTKLPIGNKPSRPKNKGKPKPPIMRQKLTRFRKRVKTHRVEIVSRKAQPKWKITAIVPKMEKVDIPMLPVSSSWIQSLSYHRKGRFAVMSLLNGYEYQIFGMSWEKFESWYYAHSKGTFFNYRVKDKYRIVRIM